MRFAHSARKHGIRDTDMEHAMQARRRFWP